MKQLGNQGYNVTDYSEFSINEIDTMFSNKQLDMLVTNENTDKKTYVKYYLDAKQVRPQYLDEIIEDLFLADTVLTKEDTLVIIIDGEPNETIISKVNYLYDHDGIFVVIHNISRLQFNILEHSLVPPIKILTDGETSQLLGKYNLKDITQLPEISRFDPQALAISLRPGQVCAIERKSVTAMKYEYYRVCI
ncbi:MAG: DNA-directed RNA polymerase subunit RpoH/Rpb5 C-terminal domain-containing protein [Flavobacterium sp.]